MNADTNENHFMVENHPGHAAAHPRAAGHHGAQGGHLPHRGRPRARIGRMGALCSPRASSGGSSLLLQESILKMKMLSNGLLALFMVVILFSFSCGGDDDGPPAGNNDPNSFTFSPATGASGDLVAIKGNSFNTNKNLNEVKFNGKYAIIASVTDTELTAVVPGGASTGKIEVNSYNSGDNRLRVSKTDFTIDAARPGIGGGPRLNAATFVIGSKGYVVAGRQSNAVLKQDVWEFDQTTKAWTQKADYPGGQVEGAFGFTINGKGYAGGGIGLGSGAGFYEYDPATNTWTKKTDFTTLVNAVPFVINGKGYVATGGDSNFSDSNILWEYNPATNTWTTLAPLPGPERASAAGFVLNNKAYIGTGYERGKSTLNDFWEYDPAMNVWTRKADFGGVARNAAIGFALNGKGYISCGGSGGMLNDTWSYDPATDKWSQSSALNAGPRVFPMAFTFANSVYVFGGRNDLETYGDVREYK